MDQGSQAEAKELIQSLHAPPEVDSREAKARTAALQGYSEQLERNWEAAEKSYAAAASELPGVDDSCWRAELLVHHQAQVLIHLSKYDEAAQSLSQAVPATEACPDKYWKASLLLVEGNLFRQQHRYEEAVLWFERCLSFSSANDLKVMIPVSLGNLAVSYHNLGDLNGALRSLNNAEQYYRQFDHLDKRQLRNWGEDRGHRARVYSSLKRYSEAIAEYKEAIRIAADTGDTDYVTRWHDELTQLYLETGDFDAADLTNREVIKTADPDRDFLVAASARLNTCRVARLRGQLGSAYSQLQDLQKVLSKDPDPDPKLTWELQIELAQTLAGMKNFGQARSEFDLAVETADSARKSITSDGYRLTYFSQLRKLYETYVDFLVDRNDVTHALLEAESAHAHLLTEKLNGKRVKGQAAHAAEIARAKAVVILSFWISPRHSYMWVTNAQGSKIFSLPQESELETDVKRLNEAIIEERDLTMEPETSRVLYDKLIRPAAALIPPGSNVIVIPDGPLAGLNFETLIPPSTSSPPHYWIESVSVTVAPSLTLLQPDRQLSIHPKSLLLAGAAIQADPDLGPLPDSERELRSIEQIFSPSARCRLLIGAEATPHKFERASPGQYSVIHLSAHAVSNVESPLDSAIILSPGSDREGYKLYAHDLAGMQLRADLVTLSACQSAGARNIPGEGLVGLTWAVLSAGAGNVIATLWKVPDASTYRLMKGLYSRLATGDSPAQALRSAKLEMIQSSKTVPYDWAAFQLYTR